MHLASPFQPRLSAFRGAALEREREDNSQGCLVHLDSMGWTAERQWCGQFGWKELYYFIHICNLPTWLFSCFMLTLASFLGVIPCQGASIEPYEALVAQGIASMVGVTQSFQPKELCCLKMSQMAICKPRWQRMSRSKHFGSWFCQGARHRVAEKEIRRRCHFGWFWNITF